MPKIRVTYPKVVAALEQYRDSMRVNPNDPSGYGCVNYRNGRFCLAAQILHDLGVPVAALAQLHVDIDGTLRSLTERGFIFAPGVRVVRLLRDVQAEADGNWSTNQPRARWGQVVKYVLGP